MILSDNEENKIKMLCTFRSIADYLRYDKNGNTLVLNYLSYYMFIKNADIIKHINHGKLIIKVDKKYYMVNVGVEDKQVELEGEPKEIKSIGEDNYIYTNTDNKIVIYDRDLREAVKIDGDYLGHYHISDRYVVIMIKDTKGKEKSVEYNIFTCKRVYGKEKAINENSGRR